MDQKSCLSVGLLSGIFNLILGMGIMFIIVWFGLRKQVTKAYINSIKNKIKSATDFDEKATYQKQLEDIIIVENAATTIVDNDNKKNKLSQCQPYYDPTLLRNYGF